MVRENSYVTIQAFMVNELGLSGNELIMFAVIYGFSQDGESWFTGSRKYLAEWCQTTTKSVTNNLQKLLEKGYIQKRSRTDHGLTFKDYRVSPSVSTLGKKVPPSGEETSLPTGEETSLHTLDKDNASRHHSNKRFIPPKPEEVRAYMHGRGTPIDADSFCDYWESVGWMRGKTKMKDWKAAARQWAKNDARWNRRGETDADLEEYLRRLDF